MTFQEESELTEDEKSEWAMDIAFDLDEYFRQRDPQYAAEHPEAHAAKEDIYENLMAGRISALDEKLAALGQTQEDYLPSELEKFKDATGYEEFLDFDPAEIRAALQTRTGPVWMKCSLLRSRRNRSMPPKLPHLCRHRRISWSSRGRSGRTAFPSTS